MSFNKIVRSLDGELQPLRYPAEDLLERYGESYAKDAASILDQLEQFAQQQGQDLKTALCCYADHIQQVVVERQRYQAGLAPYGRPAEELETLWQDRLRSQVYLYTLTLSTVFNRSRYELLRDVREALAQFATRPSAILEIGAGNCLNAGMASEYGTVDAYEKNELSQAWKCIVDPHGRINLRLALYGFDQPASYDWVLMIELLEHVTDPMSYLRGAHLVLKGSGLAYLTFAIRMPQEDHLYEFTSIDGCRRMVDESGFHIWHEQCLIDTYYPFREEERWLLGEDESQAVVYCCLVGKQPRPAAEDWWRRFNEPL